MTRDEFNKVVEKQDAVLEAAKMFFEEMWGGRDTLEDIDPEIFADLQCELNKVEHAAMVVFAASNEVVEEEDILQGLDGAWCLVNIKAPYEQGVIWGSREFLGRELAGIMGIKLSVKYTAVELIKMVELDVFADWKLFDKMLALKWLKNRRPDFTA